MSDDESQKSSESEESEEESERDRRDQSDDENAIAEEAKRQENSSELTAPVELEGDATREFATDLEVSAPVGEKESTAMEDTTVETTDGTTDQAEIQLEEVTSNLKVTVDEGTEQTLSPETERDDEKDNECIPEDGEQDEIEKDVDVSQEAKVDLDVEETENEVIEEVEKDTSLDQDENKITDDDDEVSIDIESKVDLDVEETENKVIEEVEKDTSLDQDENKMADDDDEVSIDIESKITMDLEASEEQVIDKRDEEIMPQTNKKIDKDDGQDSTEEEEEVPQEVKDDRKRREEEARREEVAEERQRKQQEKQRQEAEATKKQRKPGQKRRGLGGLSKEKKRMLKQLIMQKAAEIMKAERKKEQERRDEHVRNKIGTLSLEGMNENDLRSKVSKLHETLKGLEGEKYDWEEKLRRQDFEIIQMTVKANDNKGKFVKPVLKKVSKTESHLARFEKKEGSGHSLSSFRNQLKSTGHSKYAIEEKDESGGKPEWRDNLKPKDEEGAAAAT